MDRLIEAIDNTQNPSVVGLDPTEALVPPQVVASFADEVRDSVESPEEVESAQLAVAYFEYNRTIIDAIADIVPAVKPQIAMYEALGPAGVDIYTMTCEYAAQQGLYVLGDIKRGDIGSTAAAYAHHLNGVGDFDPWHEDAVTVNPYLGTDGITPFVEAAAEADKDIFVLVRTSNPSSSELQMLDLADGTPPTGRTITLSQYKDGLVRGSGLDRNAELIVRRDLGVLPPEELTQRCKAIGAELLPTNADFCARFDFAPRYPMWLKIWFADEEFPASGRLLLDESAPHYLTIEDAVTAASLILDRLTQTHHWT